MEVKIIGLKIKVRIWVSKIVGGEAHTSLICCETRLIMSNVFYIDVKLMVI